MISLAIESTTDRLSVAASRAGSPPVVRILDGARMHATGLLPLMEAVLRELGAGVGDLSSLALADGPGSFTGLRVAAATAKALARARPGLSVWTASTLMVRAAGVSAPPGARVLVVTSALRGELYAASYRLGLPRSVETLAPPMLATPESLHGQSPDLLVADAPDKMVDRLADQFAVPLIRGAATLPSAGALLALLGVPGGAQRIADLDGWEPDYGRPPEAQARWEATHGQSLPNSSGERR